MPAITLAASRMENWVHQRVSKSGRGLTPLTQYYGRARECWGDQALVTVSGATVEKSSVRTTAIVQRAASDGVTATEAIFWSLPTCTRRGLPSHGTDVLPPCTLTSTVPFPSQATRTVNLCSVTAKSGVRPALLPLIGGTRILSLAAIGSDG